MAAVLLLGLLGAAAQEDQRLTVAWEPLSYDEALRAAGERRLPVMIAVNMDNEVANEQLARETYRDAGVARQAQLLVPVVTNPSQHRPSGPCPRFAGRVTCAQHLALEREVRERLLRTDTVVAPQHIFLRPDGTMIARREYLLGREELLGMMRKAVLDVNPEAVSGEARGRHAAAIARIRGPASGPWRETIVELSISSDELAMSALVAVGPTLADPERRAVVAREVGMLGNHAAWDLLLGFLRDADRRVRREAARSLAKVDREKAFHPLVERLEVERDVEVREALLRALGVEGTGASKTIRQEAAERVEEVALALGLAGDPAALPHLLRMARSGDPWKARRAAEALGPLRTPEAFETLLFLLDGDRAPGMQAARALAEHGNPKAVPALVRALANRLPTVRRGAAEALGRLGAREAQDDLRARLQDDATGVRVEAALALHRIGDDAGIPTLLQALSDRWESPDARRALITIAGSDQGDADAWAAWWAARRSGGN